MIVTKYHSKLVGVTFEGRQDVIRRLAGDEFLQFRREPENEYDENAIAVDVGVDISDVPNQSALTEWLPIGYIAKDKNAELAKVIDEDKLATIRLSEITGGGDKAYGVNVEIEYEKPYVAPTTTKRLKDFFGNEIDYDEVNHVYSWKGEIYESGSQYASKFDKPFDKELIAGKMAKKYGVETQDILDMWELNAQTSMSFGTALHSALELYGKYRDLARALERDSALHSNPTLRRAVESFYKGREHEKAHYEVLVVDHKNKRAGQIDRLLENAPNDYTVQDYKTGAVLKQEKLEVYFKQLGFYSGILEANGAHTRPEQIFHYNTSWRTFNKGGKV